MFQSVKDYITKNKRYIKNTLVTVLATVIVLATLIPVAIQVGIVAESKYYPVIQDFEIEQIIMTDEGNSTISGTFYRNRVCPLEYVEWVLKNPKNEVDVPIPRYVPKTHDPTPGLNQFQGITLFIRPNDLLSQVSGTAYYRCHPFWLSKVVFYDARRAT